MGNQKGNRYWERRLPSNFSRPKDGHQLKTFIRNKYVDKMYVPDDMPPPDLQNYQSHPYCMDEKTPVAETVEEGPATVRKSAPSPPPLLSPTEKSIPVVEAQPKTSLVTLSADFISLGDDVQSNKSAPQSHGTSDWEPFTGGGSPVQESTTKVENAASSSWNALESLTQGDSISQPTTLNSDPFGLDNLQPSPKVEDGAKHQPWGQSEDVVNGKQSTEEILKLYDVPQKKGEAPLPPNLGLPMGPPQGVPLYPQLHPRPYAGSQQQQQGMNGGSHLYPHIAAPNMSQSFAAPGYSQGTAAQFGGANSGFPLYPHHFRPGQQ